MADLLFAFADSGLGNKCCPNEENCKKITMGNIACFTVVGAILGGIPLAVASCFGGGVLKYVAEAEQGNTNELTVPQAAGAEIPKAVAPTTQTMRL